MRCKRFGDASAFLHECEPFLTVHDPETNLILSNAYRLDDNPPSPDRPAYMAFVEDEKGISLAAIMGHRLPLSVYARAEVEGDALTLLVKDLLEWQTALSIGQPHSDSHDAHSGRFTKVVAPQQVAGAFADTWKAQTGVTLMQGMHMRLYQLRSVDHPGRTPGHLRLASESDTLLIARWYLEFDKEATNEQLSVADAERIAETKIGNRETFIWEDGGEAVTMVAKTRPTKQGIVLNAVYTPPVHRRRGYATGCVAAVSQRLLDEGYAFCSLFTDLTNPTSNSIYMKIGYKPMRDYYEYEFPLGGSGRS
ncbi:GNAT family N-acetyltransferase [Alicyclobacillus dauci]|uniref:GNAT family N-acetyltransferase n=1 Tax=Alicyclobacillus dauci TaxID=1475485 RepID=A0ABY6Z562_9BACL|nr:GNAT family N-acetyltransferase [Alicyclobacillus dauci]WAH37160.1 GNAT family N-acetyltransferase [Alicyclobacillus dauci]